VSTVRILSVTHGPLVRSELFGDVVHADGHELVEWEIVTQGRPPANGFDAVMIFGGDMNVGEELQHPWLHDEYELLREWIRAETPLLGVCLGAQTLAHAAGGRVARIERPQIGFQEVALTEAGVRDPVLGVLPARFAALNGNAYAFDVPSEGVELATGNGSSQAFRVGSRAWAVQFHPEVRREQVLAWWREEPTLPKPLDALEADLDEKLATWQELGRDLCRAFLGQAGS
jgi:GMP synthase-like glutamine amidotransferase